MLHFELTGRWRPPQVRATWAPSTYAPSQRVRAFIDRTWSEASAQPGRLLFDGPMCRLEHLHATPECLHLRLSRTSYRQFLGTNLAADAPIDRLGAAALANPVGLSTLLWTSDDYLVLGRRNARVAYYPLRIHPFAGALEPDDIDDVFAAMGRELFEELSLEPHEISDMACLGLVRDLALRQPELIFTTRTTRTRNQVDRALDRAEHASTLSFPATGEEWTDGQNEIESWTPVARATVLLWASVHMDKTRLARLSGAMGVALPVTAGDGAL